MAPTWALIFNYFILLFDILFLILLLKDDVLWGFFVNHGILFIHGDSGSSVWIYALVNLFKKTWSNYWAMGIQKNTEFNYLFWDHVGHYWCHMQWRWNQSSIICWIGCSEFIFWPYSFHLDLEVCMWNLYYVSFTKIGLVDLATSLDSDVHI